MYSKEMMMSICNVKDFAPAWAEPALTFGTRKSKRSAATFP